MKQIIDKYIEKLIAWCNYAIVNLMLDYENGDFKDENQEGIKKIIDNIMELSFRLDYNDGNFDISTEESLDEYEKIRNMLKNYNLRIKDILSNKSAKIKISGSTKQTLDAMLDLDIGILDLEDFVD